VRIFINGIDVTVSADTIVNPASSTEDFMIGLFTAGSIYASGSFDEFGIWSRALSPTEALQLYRRGANRLQYQVRTCIDSSCISPTNWLGPDGTNQTYFSELNNNLFQNVASDQTSNDSVLSGLPSLLFSNFGSLNLIANRYFQYSILFQSDDSQTSTSCNYASSATWCSPELKSVALTPQTEYATSGGTVSNATGIKFSTLSGFSETLGGAGCGGGTSYNLSIDNSNWYYWDGASWVIADGTVSKTSSASVINTNITSFSNGVGTGTLYVKSFLNSNGSTSCQLSNITVSGTQ
jgi:hypothetical protein